MKLKLTLPQMMERWKTIRRLHSAPISATVDRTDGTDTDELITQEIRKWYYNLLLNGDLRLLCPTDIASSLTPVPVGPAGAQVTLPADTVRVAAVSVARWTAPPVFITEPDSPLVIRQNSELTASPPSSPVVFVQGRILTLYPFSATDSLTSLSVLTLTDNIFEFDTLAFSTLLPYDTDFSF